jgi:crotonobetainyl-CoA:carnitine CoA-transferase CaiB-like acyl-CoA transferase
MLQGPYGVYQTADGGAFLFAVAMDDAAWDALWIFADMPEVAMDPRWNTAIKRVTPAGSRESLQEIRAKLRQAFCARTTREWEEFLSAQPEIIYERVQGYEEVLEDPQVKANGYLATVDVPHVGPTRMVGNLVHMSETPGSVKGPPPTLGQHTAEVMKQVGFSEDEVRQACEHAAAVRAELMATFIKQ